MDRRSFIAAAIPLLFVPRRAAARGALGATHPEPRAGITAANVLPADKVDEGAREEFEMVREIPQIIDGLRCSCGCAEREGNYSLLSCYEGNAMAQHCGVCQSTARLAHRLHKQGKDLNEIREAIDKRFN
jgi:hypothetical protein